MSQQLPEDVGAMVTEWLRKRPEHRVTQAFFDAPNTWHLVLALWFDEVQSGLFDASDSPVALARSAFWSDELSRCQQGQGKHPLTQWLSQTQAFTMPNNLDWHGTVSAWRQPQDTPADSAGTVALLTLLAQQLALMAEGWGMVIDSDHFVFDLGKAWLQADAAGSMALPTPLTHLFDQNTGSKPNNRQAFIRALLERTPRASSSRWRNIETWLCRHHLKQLNQDQTPTAPSGLRLLFSSWKAARRQAIS